ncbi:MAG: threonine/serine exporter family protein, partial [Eubacteriales bacterium]|nr:threonine/serine exporter family protein [Eubacteriales bacterium]
DFPEMAQRMTAEEIHAELDELVSSQKIYTPAVEGLASAAACAAFTFLLGGWIFEMIGAFVGAGLGNWLRDYMGTKKITLLGKTIPSVALACFSYFLTLRILSAAFGVSGSHITGYICAMLFVIPGFPLITGGIDLSKLDMRSGLERIAYAFVIILTATLTGWVTAMILRIHPNSFASLDFSQTTYLVLRLIMSFIGVFGFSLMYNSPAKMAGTAGLIGMVANTLRLELVNVFGVPGGAAAFLGAMTAGLLGSIVTKKIGYPRISLTIPSIVIMVPGMYLYRSVYNFGLDAVGEGAVWLIRGLMIILALPLGLICARLLTQKSFRHIS